ncbi:MAG: DUF3592 domain-containing protein [Planctomycetes bacterium]|nr:DUF3592 domain-containing protein [Planctomycetota bacterium]
MSVPPLKSWWARRSLGAITLFLLLIGSVLLIAGWVKFDEESALRRAGVDVEGNVIEKSQERRRRSGKKNYLTVQYSPSGGRTGDTFTRRFSVSKSVYEATSTGAAIRVRCLPSDPKIAKLAGKSDESPILLGMGGVLFVLGAGCGYAWNRRRHREQGEPVAPVTSDADRTQGTY